MLLIPAIDIRDGRCVRLLRGEFDQQTSYAFDPRELARRYRDSGAEWLHVVDLDGARSGSPANAALIREIAATASLKIQLGGGIRTERDLDRVLEYADRVVIGSLSVDDPEKVRSWMEQHGVERIVPGFDVRIDSDGVARVTTHGWTKDSGLALTEAIDLYLESGLRHVLCTDVAKDGALAGPNVDLYESCCRMWPDIAFQASGGVSDAADLDRLAATGVAAAISGKAILDGLIDLEEVGRFLPNA